MIKITAICTINGYSFHMVNELPPPEQFERTFKVEFDGNVIDLVCLTDGKHILTSMSELSDVFDTHADDDLFHGHGANTCKVSDLKEIYKLLDQLKI